MNKKDQLPVVGHSAFLTGDHPGAVCACTPCREHEADKLDAYHAQKRRELGHASIPLRRRFRNRRRPGT